jgi:DNA-binding NtrC family response regulator
MTQKPKAVLIVDDDEGMRDTLTAILKREYRVLRVASGEAALPILQREDIDLVLLDVRLPGISGFEVLRIVKENYSLVEVIMISAINEIETAVQAMTRRVSLHHQGLRLRPAAVARPRASAKFAASADAVRAGRRSDRARFVVGPSKNTRDIVDLVHRSRSWSATVLILGESGTGKVAGAAHS